MQIKSTSQKHRRGYSIKPTCNRSLLGKLEYTGEDIDILVVHIQPIDVSYVLPVAAFSPARSLNFFPGYRVPQRALGAIPRRVAVVGEQSVAH